jgi:tRNA dimethylallyltransferase
MIVLLGPTASGKTSVSIQIAKALGGEIVGADSVQIYRDLIIGSAPPTKDEMEGVPHHLTGILDLSKKISAGEYIKMASDVVTEIESRKKIPIMVGGTNFYVDAFINGLSPVPEISVEDNKDFDIRTDNVATQDLYGELAKKDPEWAGSISSPNDRQRIKRGLIVLEKTGKKISDWNKIPREKPYLGKTQVFALEINRNELYQRINLRAKQMVDSGIIEELQKINVRGFNSLNCPVLNSIGYKETGMFLNKEISTREDLIELIAKNTRHLAKRQLTWLRNRDYVNWTDRNNALELVVNHYEPNSKVSK